MIVTAKVAVEQAIDEGAQRRTQVTPAGIVQIQARYRRRPVGQHAPQPSIAQGLGDPVVIVGVQDTEPLQGSRYHDVLMVGDQRALADVLGAPAALDEFPSRHLSAARETPVDAGVITEVIRVLGSPDLAR